tara:strand:+ start:412 stop:612 length:201 start_codon:yes stop_codon:yes gene_type:complete
MGSTDFANEVDKLCAKLIDVVSKEVEDKNQTTKVYFNDLIDVLQEARQSAHKAQRLMDKYNRGKVH